MFLSQSLSISKSSVFFILISILFFNLSASEDCCGGQLNEGVVNTLDEKAFLKEDSAPVLASPISSESKTLKMKVKELPLLRNQQRKDAGGQESRSTKVMLRKRSRPQKVAADQRKLLREMLRNHRTNQVKSHLKMASSLMSSSTIHLKWSPKRPTRREELNQLLDLKAAKRKVRINLHQKQRSRKLSQKRRNRNLHQNRKKLRLKRKLKRQFLKIQMQRC